MKRIIIAAFLYLIASPVFAQSSPSWTFGYVPTSAQWNAQWASKQDYLGAPPLLTTGGTMTGKLTTSTPTTLNAGLNLPSGAAPSSPINGDIWTTSAGLFVQINGVMIGPISGASSASFAATTPITLSFPAGVVTYACATCGVTGSPLSQFAATTSAQLLGIISDETGSGLSVFNNGPTLIAPILGAAAATSINKVTITTPATSAVLTIANGKTLTASNTLTFTGTDGTSFAFPGSSDTVVTLGATQTLTAKTITATSNVLGGVTMTLGSDGTGDIYYRSAGGLLTRLGIGSNTNVLTISSGLPSWQAGTAASSINAGTTTVVGTCSTLQLLFNNAGVSGCENIASILTAGNGISITGTTNATITNTGLVKVQPAQKISATATYTPTTGMIFVQVECVGGGGAGGGIASGTASGAAGSGGSGAYSRVILTAAQIGASKAITIPAVASGGVAGNNAGATGGDVSLGALCVAKGGVGGGGSAAPNQAAGGAGGLASGGTGDVKINGSGGSAGAGSSAVTINLVSGPGGSSYFGGGAAGTANNASGNIGSDCGGGGSGGASNNVGNFAGGAGAVGCVVLTEFTNQ